MSWCRHDIQRQRWKFSIWEHILEMVIRNLSSTTQQRWSWWDNRRVQRINGTTIETKELIYGLKRSSHQRKENHSLPASDSVDVSRFINCSFDRNSPYGYHDPAPPSRTCMHQSRSPKRMADPRTCGAIGLHWRCVMFDQDSFCID